MSGRRVPTAGDVMAGTSVALVLIPQSVAYAAIAGLPAEVGLYAAAAAPLAGSLVGSSPYLQTGPTALTSLLVLGALSSVPDADVLGAAALLALIVGATRILVGLARAGLVNRLLSQPVVQAFSIGAALLIIASQIPGALGVDADGESPLVRAARAVADPGAWRGTTMLFAAGAVAVMVLSRFVSRLFPGALLAALGGLVVARSIDFDGAVVGRLPDGLPTPSLDLPWGDLGSLVVPGVVIALIGFVEAAAIARRFATADRTTWDADREFVGQGLANVAAGVFGGYPVGGSFGRSALSRESGATSRWSGAVAGLVVIALLPFADLLEELPVAVLTGIVIAAVAPLADPRPLVRYWRHTRLQSWVAVVTMAATLGLAPRVDLAVLIGVAAAVLAHLYRELPVTVDVWIGGRELHLRPRGVLFFGSAPSVEAALDRQLAAHPEALAVVFHLDGLGRIDVTGAYALEQVVGDLLAADVEVTIVDVPPQSIKVVRRTLGHDVPVAPAPQDL